MDSAGRNTCEEQRIACEQSPQCLEINDCNTECPDQACFSQCFEDNPAGQAAYVDLFNCAIGPGGNGGVCAYICEVG